MLGTRLKELREARGWSQSQLSRASGVAQGYISSIENGERKRVSGDVLRKLAGAFDTTVDALLGSGPAENLDSPPRALLQEAGYTPKLIEDLVESWPRQSAAFRLKVVAAAKRRIQEAHDLYGAIL